MEERMFPLTAKVAAVVLLSAGALTAASPQPSSPPENKKPWEWTIAERLAVRLDPARITERELEDETQRRALGTQAKAAPRERVNSYTIDGRRHPDLLLPHELFDGLLTGFVPNETRQARQRKNFAPAIVSAGFDERLFWAQLYSVASAYVSYKYAETGRSMDSAANRDRDHACRLAFDALTAARQLFGQERFDRLLYQGIAPLTQVASATNAIDPAADLQRVAAGCR
jgi:hypothetical protein